MFGSAVMQAWLAFGRVVYASIGARPLHLSLETPLPGDSSRQVLQHLRIHSHTCKQEGVTLVASACATSDVRQLTPDVC